MIISAAMPRMPSSAGICVNFFVTGLPVTPLLDLRESCRTLIVAGADPVFIEEMWIPVVPALAAYAEEHLRYAAHMHGLLAEAFNVYRQRQAIRARADQRDIELAP